MIDLTKHAKKEPMADYLANQSWSASKCKAILRSPLHYKTEFIDGIKEETEAMRFGEICHAAILEPDRFLKNVLVEPEFTGLTKDGKESKLSGEAREKKKVWWQAVAPENIVVTAEEQMALMGIIRSVKSHKTAREKLTRGIAEHSMYFTDPTTKLPCKFRPDFLTEDGWILDVKTARSAKRTSFMRNFAESDDGRGMYEVSAAFSTMGFREIFGQDPRGYVFIVVEKKAPWATAVYVADETVIDIGHREVRTALALAKQCIETNHYPGYQDDQAENISMPPWRLWDEA